MATYAKMKLSASTNGKGILVAATATPGTIIHTAVAGTVDMDEVWLYVTNNHTAQLALTLEWGGVAAADLIQLAVPSKTGLYLIVPGFVLQNGLLVRAYAQTTNLLTIHGWVNRIMN